MSVEYLIILVVLVNVVALVGALYFLVDRYACLRDAYRLLRLLREVEPRTYRYIAGWSPFSWVFSPQRLIEFLLDFELEEHYAIKQQKNKCRCWMEYYSTLSDYVLRLGKIALASPFILIGFVLLVAIILRNSVGAGFP